MVKGQLPEGSCHDGAEDAVGGVRGRTSDIRDGGDAQHCRDDQPPVGRSCGRPVAFQTPVTMWLGDFCPLWLSTIPKCQVFLVLAVLGRGLTGE